MLLDRSLAPAVAILAVLASVPEGRAQIFRASFDAGLNAAQAQGRVQPWVSKGVEFVPGKYGQAVRVPAGASLIYGAERNLQAGRGTVAFWCRIPTRPGPHDVQRLLFVQSKERGYWTYLATMEWQESVFRAQVFDPFHGHGWHDPEGLPSFKPQTWHHLALAWDQAAGAKFYLDGRLLGSSWGKQPWWERLTPHAIHLCYPDAEYDELCVFDFPLTDDEVAALARENRWKIGRSAYVPTAADRANLEKALNALGVEALPTVDLAAKPGGAPVLLRQARVRQVLDDRIPSWKVVDGRLNLFWPEWQAPTLGDVDYSGSELTLSFEPGQQLTHLTLRGLLSGCRIHGVRQDYVSRAPLLSVPEGLHFVAAAKLPPGLTGLHVLRNEGMKLHEIGALAFDHSKSTGPANPVSTPLTGTVDWKNVAGFAEALSARTLPHERLVLGKTAGSTPARHAVAGLSRVHLLSEPVAEITPLDAVRVSLTLTAPWQESVWWLRVQDPVNPRRDLLHVPVRLRNSTPGTEVSFDIVLDFWDVMLDPGTRIWIELTPLHDVTLITGGKQPSELSLWPGERAKVLREFAHTQSQLAYSYWQLGSEANGTRGSDPENPGFALLGHITHNHELKLTLDWVRRHVPDHPLTENLWKITHGKLNPAPIKPRLAPAGAPDWAVWGRETLERFRAMAHVWADRQSPDGQVGGGWNDDTDFPGVFICLPLLGDEKTHAMFRRIFDGLEKTGYLHNGVARAPIDALHATDFLSWRAHLMLFDYGAPRHVERALALMRELHKWTRLDAKGRRRFLTGFYSEDGPDHQPTTEIGDGGLVEKTGAGQDSPANRNFLRDLLFCAWYSRNPAVLRFLREVAEADHAAVQEGAKLQAYQAYPFYSYFKLFRERKYLEGPVDPFLRDRWNLPIWRRYVEGLPNGTRLDAQLLKAAQSKTAAEESLTAAYLVGRDRKFLVQALKQSCEYLEAGWQFRGGAAGGANDHFFVPGQAALSQLYLGGALTWLRPASILPPIAVSWENIDADVAALVHRADPKNLTIALYNFAEQPRKVRFRVWELEDGQYRLRHGPDADQDDRIDGPAQESTVTLHRAAAVQITLPPRQVWIVELEQVQRIGRPELLPDLAIGAEDVFYDKATDRLKAVVHNIGAAAAKDVVVRFETPDGQLLAQRRIAVLEAPVDLQPRTAVVWLGQPLLHPVAGIRVRIDPEAQIDEITRENNSILWR